MATYNGEKYIKEQLDSILCQLSNEDEIVISDDGSTDKTIEIIENYKDKRIKLFHHKSDEKLKRMYKASYRLVTNNFENALLQAKGDYIFLSDQDDIWVPRRIDKVLSCLENYDMVMCNRRLIDGNGDVLINKYFSENPYSKCVLKSIISQGFMGCCMAFKRKALDIILPFPKTLVTHDFWIGLMITYLGTFTYIDEPLHSYRVHSHNVSCILKKNMNPLSFKIYYRLQLLYNLILYSIRYMKLNKQKQYGSSWIFCYCKKK
jgi:glycosyltransferase involved in cell wall biosynthesis